MSLPRPAVARAPIGPRLRAARHARGLSIDALAAATGLTKSFLSKMERDTANASVASLLRVCDALGLRPGTLFDPPESALVRADEAPDVHYGGDGVTDKLLTPSAQGKIMMIRSEIVPGGSSGDEPYAMDADVEVAHVLAGELEISIGTEVNILYAGDTLTFAPRDPRRWRNASTSVATVLWTLTPAP
jgi:transcriptional regulator with XRE-family HTH domain